MQENRKSFHHQLDVIKADMVRVAAMVTETIPRATEVLLNGDLQDAQSLIEDDDPIDVLSVDIEERCYQVLALQQPMAGDLRCIVTAIRMTSEIERSGDLCVNIAKGARRLYGTELPPRLRGHISHMSEESTRLFRLAMDAYVEEDAAMAAALDDLDDRLDNIHKEYIAAIFDSISLLEVQSAVQLALIGRYYERIGDHAVNIGQRIRYMVTGWMPEHAASLRTNAARPVDESPGSESASNNGSGRRSDDVAPPSADGPTMIEPES